MVAASVMRRPAANSDWMPSRFSMVAICGPPPCTTTGLMAVCSSSTMSRANALASFLGAHGMAAIFDDDGFLVILLHVRQRLGQDAGLIERTDVRHVGHEGGLAVSGVGRFLSDCRARRKASLVPSARRKGKFSCNSPARPCRRHREREPARDQERAAGRRGKGKQAVAGKLPQAQVGGEQGGCDDKTPGGHDPDPGMDDAALEPAPRWRAPRRRETAASTTPGPAATHRPGARRPPPG